MVGRREARRGGSPGWVAGGRGPVPRGDTGRIHPIRLYFGFGLGSVGSIWVRRSEGFSGFKLVSVASA